MSIHVSRFPLNLEKAGVGVFVDSCRKCKSCKTGEEQYCTGTTGGLQSAAFTYNHQVGEEWLHGGYSKAIVVDENYSVHIPDNLDLSAAAPLLCASITVYSPIKHYGVRSNHAVGVLGLGGLGHLAVKLLAAMGCDVSVISTSAKKEALAKQLGAHNFIISSEESVKANAGTLDFIIDTGM